MSGNMEKGWEVFDGLGEVDGGWGNGEVFIRREGRGDKEGIGGGNGMREKDRLEKM